MQPRGRHILIISLLWTIWSIPSAMGQTIPTPSRVPAYPGIIARIQPTGDTLHVYLRGDERRHYMMTTDGWEVTEGQDGTICYTYQNKKGEIVSSGRVAHDEQERSCCEKCWIRRKGIQKMNKQK